MKDSEKVWLIGSGLMAIEYAKVLNSLNVDFICIGRGKGNVRKFSSEIRIDCISGGLDNFLKQKPPLPEAVLVTASLESLTETVKLLLEYGVRKILVEKPGVSVPDEVIELNQLAHKRKASVFVAYNRRFYASVMAVQDLIKQDGGLTSFVFEFTEWSHKIKELTKHPYEHNFWFLGNSTHVIDTAFYLAGKPKTICSFVKGKNHLDWHPASSIYSGAGETENGAIFSYHANWEAPGRWVIELLTKQRRFLFKPLEKLQIQKLGSVEISVAEGIDYSYDEKFKPGLYIQLKKFVGGDYSNLCTLEEQESMMSVYKKMAGY